MRDDRAIHRPLRGKNLRGSIAPLRVHLRLANRQFEREERSVKAPQFSYVRAESVAHALGLLAQHGEDARILAGGQSLMPTLNMRLS
jgi:hypothetical protein